MRVGVWAPTQRISKRNSTGNASWGVGQQREMDSQFLQTMQVGGPNIEADGKSAYNNVQVGVTIKKYFSIEISISYA